MLQGHHDGGSSLLEKHELGSVRPVSSTTAIVFAADFVVPSFETSRHSEAGGITALQYGIPQPTID